MAKVKLRKGIRSYTTRFDGVLINASQDNNTIDVESSAAEYLVSTGYFEEIPESANVDDDVDIDFDAPNDNDNSENGEGKNHAGAPKTVELDKMKNEELIAYAEKIGVTVDGSATKAEIKQAILDAINGGTSEIFTE